MKKRFLLFCVGCAVLSSCVQGSFTIEGRVPSLADSTMLVLSRREGGMLRMVDTTWSEAGRFSFRYPAAEKEQMALLGFAEGLPQTLLTVWAAPGQKAVVSGGDLLIGSWSVDSPIPEQREVEYYKQGLKAEKEELQRIGLQMNALRASGGSRAEMDALGEQERVLQYRMYVKELELLAAAEPSGIFLDELWGVGLMVFHYEESFGGLKPGVIVQYERLTDELKASQRGRELTGFLYPPEKVEVGDQMADDELADLSGRTHKLSDYKGRYILLDFWASWCGPCRMAMPELAEAAKEWADRLTVVGINSDESHGVWAEASEQLGVTWVNLNAPGQSEIAARYSVNGIPHQVLVSPEGIVVGAWTGYREGYLREQLTRYMK